MNWGQGEFVYGRQYAVSAVISQSKNQSAMNLQVTQMCIFSISFQSTELKYLDKQIGTVEKTRTDIEKHKIAAW